jgi:Protein of unknown function (DUF2630)
MTRRDQTSKDERTDDDVLDRIQRLASETHGLYAKATFGPGDRERLGKIRIELDQCWDLLRQRQALRDAGRDPDQAQVRPPDVVERYTG